MTDLGRSLERALNDLDFSTSIPLPPDESIPTDPERFYQSFGYLTHPRTAKPVTSLAQYQIDVMKSMQQNQRTLVIKSNRIGISVACLLEVFHSSILPTSNPLS